MCQNAEEREGGNRAEEEYLERQKIGQREREREMVMIWWLSGAWSQLWSQALRVEKKALSWDLQGRGVGGVS